jgi:hypothetical protein
VIIDVVHPDYVEKTLTRAMLWHPGGLTDWSLSDWLCATGGELGEAMNAAKKWNRINDGIANLSSDESRQISDAEEARMKILDELGDTFAYLVLTALRVGTIEEFNEAVVTKFNQVSVRYGFPVFV